MRTVQLLDPTAKPHDDAQPLAQRHLDLSGKRVGILDNTKSNADILMKRMATLLLRATRRGRSHSPAQSTCCHRRDP